MSVSAETYIVISLMFAVFAAVAAVGTSLVLGAGFERLRAGFEVVRRQSGFFADAIYKLDQRTQKLDEEQAKMKAGVYNIGERMDRVEKQVTFMGDAVSSIEHRILQGTPAQQPVRDPLRMSQPVHSDRPAMAPKTQTGQIVMPGLSMAKPATGPREESLTASLIREMPEQAMRSDAVEAPDAHPMDDTGESSVGLTTLLSRYFTGEQSGSGKGVVYH